MKIIQLAAENIKKLRAVEITPTGEIVTIAGKNGAGKTSVLDSIWWLLAGKKNIQAQPIRRGETTAKIKAHLGGQAVELIAERTFTKKGEDEYTSSLTVTTAEGFTPPGGPQAVLDALLGDLSFDPFAFARAEADEQFEELRRVSKLDVDIVQLDQLNSADYAKRTNVNRDAKAKRAQAAAISSRTKRRAIETEAEALEKQSRDLTENMEARETAKRTAIMSARLPVEGLGFGDGIVTFNDVPFDQASTAEQLRVSLAIAMAANPKLRVIRIQDGSLLDNDSLAQIAAMAKEHDYQVWIERVETDGQAAILIEDGSVKERASE